MKPSNWLILFISINLTLMFFNIIIYFFFNFLKLNNLIKINNYKKKEWKW